MQKRILLAALDVLNECVIYQHKSDKFTPWLKKIAGSLDQFFQISNFTDILNQTKSYKEKLKEYDNNLFINSLILPTAIESETILDYSDRLILFIAILGWPKEFFFNLEEIPDKIAVNLKLIESDKRLTQLFFNDSEESTNQNNILILKSGKYSTEDNLEGTWIDDNTPNLKNKDDKQLYSTIDETLKIAYFENINHFLIRCLSSKSIIKKGEIVSPTSWEILKAGEEALVNNCAIVSYSELKTRLITQQFQEKVRVSAWKASVSFQNSKTIGNLSINYGSGRLIGIIGKEGSGKSTILKLLAGKTKASKGKVYINGYNLNKNIYQLKGVIGYIPEEDLLFDELTVYENLYFSARLYLGNISKSEINKRVENILNEIGLSYIKHIKVGTFHNKNIQPGQRRLLNIALELIREPDILFVDNSVAPLSINDAARVIEILNRFTFRGKLVITTITQVDETTFHQFDNLIVLDYNGLPIYNGTKENAFPYFKQWYPEGVWKKYEEGTLTPDSILNLVGEINEIEGRQCRYCSSQFLHDRYRENLQKNEDQTEKKKSIPGNIYSSPTLDRQYLIFNLRNFRSKIARKRDLIFTFSSASVISFILALLLRGKVGGDYVLVENSNLPAYFYLSIIIALFFGLTQSANEILKERNILNKEMFLNLSRFSYINSKITYLFIIILIQTFLYVIIGNFVIGIRGMSLNHWVFYASLATFGMLLGLNFSLYYKSLVGILTKAIPITIILQLAFSGGLIEQNNKYRSQEPFTPLVSDIMLCKWAYEGIMVEQFRKNKYNQYFFNVNRAISQSSYVVTHQLPILESQIKFCNDYNRTYTDSVSFLLKNITEQFYKLADKPDIFPFEYIDSLNIDNFNNYYAGQALEYLTYLEIQYFSQYENSLQNRQLLIDSLEKASYKGYTEQLKKKHHNYAVADLVLNRSISDATIFYKNKAYQISDPIYQVPSNDFGRTMMFFSEKMFNGRIINTLEFNLSIIWLMNLVLYLLLITNVIDAIRNSFKRMI